MSDLLVLRGMSKRFRGNLAVDEVTFEVSQGQIVGLIGPNGAGKSTVFNCIAGALLPSSGGIAFDGHDVTRLPGHTRARLGIGRTFQIVRPFHSFTVAEQVQVGAGIGNYSSIWRSLRMRPPADRDVGDLLRRLQLSEYADQLADTLPLGIQRRVEIARAEAGAPRLLLLDEPGAGLTDLELLELSTHVEALRALGRTIVLIEHSMDFAMSTCDRILVLVKGRLIADGSPAEIRVNPQVVAAYLGEESP